MSNVFYQLLCGAGDGDNGGSGDEGKENGKGRERKRQKRELMHYTPFPIMAAGRLAGNSDGDGGGGLLGKAASAMCLISRMIG